MRGARDSAGWAVGSGRVGWEPPLGPTCRRSSPSTGGVMTPLPHTAGAMANSRETRRLPRAEATRRFAPDPAEMRADLPGLGRGTHFLCLFLPQASPSLSSPSRRQGL